MNRRLTFLALLIGAPGVAGGPEPSFPRPDQGVYLFIDGSIDEAIRAQDACASKGDAKCSPLAAQMREFQALVRRAEKLTFTEVQDLFWLDRRICEGQISKAYLRTADVVAAASCSRARAAMERGDTKAACAFADIGLFASPRNDCIWGLAGWRGTDALERLQEMSRLRVWLDRSGLAAEAMKQFREDVCGTWLDWFFKREDGPAELEPGLRPSDTSR